MTDVSIGDLVAQLLGPLGLVAGCLLAIWAFVTERVVSGRAHRRQIEINEALLGRLEGLASVTRRAVQHAETSSRADERP